MVEFFTHDDFTLSGETYDIIFDTVGKVAFSRCKSALKDNGIYLTTVPNLTVLTHMLKRSGKRAKFMAAGLRSPAAKTEDLLFIKEQIETGRLISVIDRCYPLEELADAHRYVVVGHKKGNVVISVNHGTKP